MADKRKKYIQELMEITQLMTVFDVYDSEADALAAMDV